MNIKKILKIVVCLVLVCALMVQISPIKSEAFAMEMALTGVAAAGAVGLLYLAMAGGAVYVPEGLGTFEAVGTAFTEYMYQWGSTAEQLEENEQFFGGLTLYGGNPDDDGDDDIDRKVRPLDWIRRGAALFTAAAILAECAIVEQKEVPATTGWSYYGDYYLPTIPIYDDAPYITLTSTSTGYTIYWTNQPFYDYSYSGTNYAFRLVSTATGYYSKVTNTEIENWNLSSSYRKSGSTTWGHEYNQCPNVTYQWSNYDFFSFKDNSLVASGSEPCTSFVQEEAVEPNSFVTAVKDQLSSGELSANDLVIPDINYENLIGSDGSLVTGITDILTRLDEGIITHEEFMEIVAVPIPVPDPVPDPSEDPTIPSSPEIIAPDDPDVDVDVGDETLANTNAQTFLEQLSDVVTTPFKWIWGKIETFFSKALKPEIWLDPLPEIALQPAKWIWEKIEKTFAPLLDPETRRAPFEWIWGKIEPIPGIITDAVADAAEEVKNAVKSLVVPEKDYLSDKVAALCAEFAFADAIVRTAQALHLGLVNIATEPPVIYIDLGAFRGDYNIGGRVPFLDLRWYAEYKPTVDIIISAFLWICFAWRMFLKLPGIISGMPGDFVAGSADAFGLRDMLPARNADYAQERAEIRKSLWKGRNK